MMRDADSLADELMGENYFAAIDARREDEGEERDDWYARYCRRKREELAAINAHTARIRQARTEMAAEMAELDSAELKEVA